MGKISLPTLRTMSVKKYMLRGRIGFGTSGRRHLVAKTPFQVPKTCCRTTSSKCQNLYLSMCVGDKTTQEMRVLEFVYTPSAKTPLAVLQRFWHLLALQCHVPEVTKPPQSQSICFHTQSQSLSRRNGQPGNQMGVQLRGFSSGSSNPKRSLTTGLQKPGAATL